MDAAKIPGPLLRRLWEQHYPDGDDLNPVEGVPPLNYAASSAPDCVEELLLLGADPNAPCSIDGRTPLMYAVYQPQCSLRVVELLLSAGADPLAVDRHGYSAFGLALAHGKGALAARLIAAGSAVEGCFPVSCQETVLSTAAKFAPQALPLLVRRLADIHATDHAGRGVLHLLASHDAMEVLPPPKAVRVLEDLWRQGVDCGARDHEGNTPLHLAPHTSPLMCQWLLRKGADCNAANAAGLTPLMLASMETPALARQLLAHGANLHARSRRGVDALMSACMFPSSWFERELMAHHRVAGALCREMPEDMLLKSSHRNPPLAPMGALRLAAIPMNMSFDTMARELLERGANARATARDGSTALMCAARYQPENVELLLAHGAVVSLRDRSGWTALMCAAGAVRSEVAVSALLDAGADPREALEKDVVWCRFQANPRALALLQAALLRQGTQTAGSGAARVRL